MPSPRQWPNDRPVFVKDGMAGSAFPARGRGLDAMSFILWNDDLVTGIDIVDAQHRSLVEMLNEAAPTLAVSSGESLQQDVHLLLDRLVSYTALHFKTEEDLMVSSRVDARVLDHHRSTHADLVVQVTNMVRDFTSGHGVTGDRLLSFLASWLIFHILGEDQTMARQIHAVERGESPEAAYLSAHGDQLSPSTGALSRALVEVYTNVSRQNRELTVLNGELAQHQDHLEELVRERTLQLEKLADELRLARDAAVAGSEAKTRFLAAVSHELRTPINAVIGFSKILQNRVQEPESRQLAEHVARAGGHLLELINDILDYARTGDEAAATEGRSFGVRLLLDEACQAALDKAAKKGLRTAVELDPSLPGTLKGDPERIARILRQLVENAVKFTKSGGIRIEVGRHAEAGCKGCIRFSVRDTGIGIDPAQQARLFDAFSQLDSRMDRQYEGVGLGLAMSRTLAHRMGGELGVSSVPGKGSLFWLDVPLLAGDPSVVHVAAAPASKDDRPPTLASGPRITEASWAALAELESLLVASNTHANAFLNKEPGLKTLLAEDFDTIAAQVADFDYEQALATLKSWRARYQRRKTHG